MANEHLILCGGSQRSSRKQCWRGAKTIELDTAPKTGNVHLRISDISKALTATLSALDLDLLEIAAYIYCADQAATRGGTKEFDYGRRWIRTFRFEVPVREPDFWAADTINEDLCRTLSNLSGDNYEFKFRKLDATRRQPDYFEFGSDDPDPIQEVMLFSGGLDSFGGAVEETLTRGRRVALVSHRSTPKINTRLKKLVARIQQQITDVKKHPLHVPVLVNKDEELGRDYTQRTRSFLFASLGAVVARLFGLHRIRFYENGVTSLNLPMSPQVVSTRATRTTHPMVLCGYARIFSHVSSSSFEVENPFAWKTKTEVLSDIKRAGHSQLCADTSSCAHTRRMSSQYTHCGRCSQCVDRRLVSLAAEYGDNEDPPEKYASQVLTGPVDGVDLALVESYLEVVKRVANTESAESFCLEFPEINRVINHIDGRADDVATAIWNLYKRHAQQVGGAIDREGGRLYSAMRMDAIAPNTMIRIAVAGRLDFLAKPAEAPEAEVGDPTCALEIDVERFSIRWNGNGLIEIGNRKEFRFFQELYSSEGKYIPFAELAERLGGDSFDDVKPIKSRLAKILKDAGHNDLAACIKTQKGHYGLILPRNQKVNGAQS